MKEENKNILDAYDKTIILEYGNAQDIIMKYLKSIDDAYGWEKHKYIEISDLARAPEFKGINFKKIQLAATALAAKHKIDYDGISRINGLLKEESINEDTDAETTHIKNSIDKILSRLPRVIGMPPIKITKIDKKVKFEISLSSFLDDENMDNFSKIDAIQDLFTKEYGEDTMVRFKGRRIEVEE
jgi:hypothetical protein